MSEKMYDCLKCTQILGKVQLEVNINRMVHVNYRGKRDILPSLEPPPSRLTGLMHREENKDMPSGPSNQT